MAHKSFREFLIISLIMLLIVETLERKKNPLSYVQDYDKSHISSAYLSISHRTKKTALFYRHDNPDAYLPLSHIAPRNFRNNYAIAVSKREYKKLPYKLMSRVKKSNLWSCFMHAIILCFQSYWCVHKFIKTQTNRERKTAHCEIRA